MNVYLFQGDCELGLFCLFVAEEMLYSIIAVSDQGS